MADVQDNNTTAPVADQEAKPASAHVNGDSTAQEATATSNGDLAMTKEDVNTAGTQATTEVNAPDGESKVEADVDGAADAAAEGADAPNKSKRKSSSGVPEHKSKKLNKKKSMPNMNLDLEPGDAVWARLKGYAPWPAIVCDESMLPESLLGNRPVSTKRPDGTYREDFADGGKNVRDRTYPVMFLSTNEFAWMVNTALTRLEPSECEGDHVEKKKLTAALRDAYRIAAEAHDLDHFKGLLREHEKELQKFEDEQREKAEKKAAEAAEKAEKKAEKEKRKSKGGADADTNEDGKPSKKRKKEADSDGDGPKAKKTPKVKLSAKDPSSESAKKSKPKKKAEEAAAPAISEEERLARREKSILYLRHRLQKCFLTAGVTPAEAAMADMADFFTQLEAHKDLEPTIIRKTKIHKVLKNIRRLDFIPQEEKYRFKARSADLLDHWNVGLSGSAEGDASVIESSTAAPATNGDGHKAEEEKAEPAEEHADITMADAPAETSIEKPVEAKTESTEVDKPAAAEPPKEAGEASEMKTETA